MSREHEVEVEIDGVDLRIGEKVAGVLRFFGDTENIKIMAGMVFTFFWFLLALFILSEIIESARCGAGCYQLKLLEEKKIFMEGCLGDDYAEEFCLEWWSGR